MTNQNLNDCLSISKYTKWNNITWSRSKISEKKSWKGQSQMFMKKIEMNSSRTWILFLKYNFNHNSVSRSLKINFLPISKAVKLCFYLLLLTLAFQKSCLTLSIDNGYWNRFLRRWLFFTQKSFLYESIFSNLSLNIYFLKFPFIVDPWASFDKNLEIGHTLEVFVINWFSGNQLVCQIIFDFAR